MPRAPRLSVPLPLAICEKDEEGREVFVCLQCRRMKNIKKLIWFPWEFPRHLEQKHKIPQDAFQLRKALIGEWNEQFEKVYLEKLGDAFYNEPSIDDDPLSKKFKEEEKRLRKKAQETERDGY